MPFEQLYVCNPEDSVNINRVQSSFTSSAALASKMPSKAYEFMQNEQSLLITSAAAAAAQAVVPSLGSNSGLKRSSTDVFNKYSNVVDNCLTHYMSMSKNQKYRKNCFSFFFVNI